MAARAFLEESHGPRLARQLVLVSHAITLVQDSIKLQSSIVYDSSPKAAKPSVSAKCLFLMRDPSCCKLTQCVRVMCVHDAAKEHQANKFSKREAATFAVYKHGLEVHVRHTVCHGILVSSAHSTQLRMGLDVFVRDMYIYVYRCLSSVLFLYLSISLSISRLSCLHDLFKRWSHACVMQIGLQELRRPRLHWCCLSSVVFWLVLFFFERLHLAVLYTCIELCTCMSVPQWHSVDVCQMGCDVVIVLWVCRGGGVGVVAGPAIGI